MRSVLYLLALLLMAVSLNVKALTFEELQLQMQQYPTLRCNYTQEKKIKELASPLISQGTMLLSRQYGLYWQQLIPFDMSLCATETDFIQTLAGQQPQVVSRNDNPMLFEIIHTLKALFSGDKEALETNFTTDFRSTGNNWELILTPKQEPFSLIFSELRVSGTDFIDKLQLFDKGGDLTTLTFTEHKTTPQDLTDNEKAAFNR